MTAYIIYQAQITDPEQYARYREKSAPALAEAGGEFLVRGGEIEQLEGEPPLGRTVIAKFESMEAARAFFYSKDYGEAKALRQGAAITNAYIVEGIE